jgi:L-lactate permease
MRKSARSRRSAAAFYVASIAVVFGVCCMTRTCVSWVDDAMPDIVPALLGIAALLLATIAVLHDGRRPRPKAAEAPADPSPPTSAPR